MAIQNTKNPRLTSLNLRVLRDIEAKMPEGGDRVDGEPAVPQPALDRRERYHARRLAVRGRLRRVETDAPWFARRTVLYGSVAEAADDPQSVVREPVHVPRQPEVHVAYRAALFSGVPLYTTRLVRERTFTFPTRDQVRSPADAAVVLAEYFSDRDREEFVVAFLDTANTLTGLHVASVGGLAASIVEPRQVFKAAVLANAAAVLLAHNHPSGNPEPSREDVAVTRQLVEAGKVMGIPVHDHLILTDHGHTSLAERGLM
ncbi:JAB domain-containing protein [Rubrivirga litoralis]|uniref:JAB domain-containing protein n=1 Tax=Rubrivirga litoralis TaxID=3075598 RepID=A0ABU3BRN0_9BACT|nr:JAB domain-containing protein [Rubrivirga sp. F394]MDT0631947.1 JAB domain-containing protein [Rubrivirga sp. F394]